jgi:hypothetical protein
MRLVRHLHGSQATSMPLKTNSLANALARKPKDSSPSLKSQQYMPRKASWLKSLRSRIFMGRNPPTHHSLARTLTATPICTVILNSLSTPYSAGVLKCSRLYSRKGVYSLSRCAFYLCLTKPKAFTEILPMPHRFQSPKLFPCPPLSRSLLFPVPVSFAFPSLSRFLALSDLLYFVPVRGRAA